MSDSTGQQETELTVDLLQRILQDSSAPPAARPGGDQRRTPRTRLNVQATLLPFSDRFSEGTLVAPLRDLSAGGFGFLHDRQIPLGEQFALVLNDSSSQPIVVLCTVAFWQPLAEGLFGIGAKFCRILRAGQSDLPLVFHDEHSGERVDLRKAS